MTSVSINISTAITNAINSFSFARKATANITKSARTTYPQPTHRQILKQHNISDELMSYLTSQHKQQHTPNSCKTQSKRFISSISSAINSGKLTVSDINDHSSSQSIALNHARITALLGELRLDCADLSPIQFSIIINQLFPAAKQAAITSTHSTVCHIDGSTNPERRNAYLVTYQDFINALSINQSISTDEVA